MSIVVGQTSVFSTSVLWPFTRNTPALVENSECTAGCSGHGVCSNGVCHCDEGWRGDNCAASTCHFMCHGHGQCVAGSCVCHAGYSGDACEHGSEPTCPQHCSGNGWCVPRWQAQAVQRLGGAGALAANTTSVEQPAAMVAAEPPLDEAARHAVVCVCVKGWRGAACSVDTCPKHCEGRGHCESGACVCSDGWQGPSCGERLYHPPPPPPPSPPPPPWVCPTAYDCSGRGTCEHGACACRPGFEGERCEKVTNACPGGCSGHGRCDAVRGICVCSLGYAGEDCGRSACATPDDESPHGCHGRGHCECDRATRSCECQCQVGFAPPLCANTTCQADCHSAEGHGVCVRGKCQCNGDINSGWRGADCGVDICPRGCSPPNGRCVDGDCVCEAGWRGRACEISTCPGTKGESVTCSNHGRCDVNHKLDVRCICEPGFKGDDCGTAKNSTAGRIDCARRECSGEDHGSCATDDEPPCICKPGWAGDKCERLLCPASCSGHGFCTDAGCRCYQGWRGGDCASAACVNDCMGHGECHSGTCLCEAGWADRDCSLPVRQRAEPPEMT